MTKKLGCNLDTSNLKTTSIVDNTEVAIFLDPFHVIKLIRNSFKFYKKNIDNQGNVM